MEDSDEPLDKEEKVREDTVPGTESIGISELDALFKMPMPNEDLEEEVEKEVQWQVIARMRAFKRSRGEEVKDEEVYEDLEPVLVQEMDGEKERETEVVDVNMAGLSGIKTS